MAVQRLHLDPVDSPHLLARRGAAQRRLCPSLCERHLDGGDHPRGDRLDRDVSPGARRVHEAPLARVCARGAGDRRLGHLAHVRAHPAECQPRHPGAALASRRRVHQGGGDPLLPRAGRAGGHGVLGHDALGGADRAGHRQVVAARGGDGVHGRFPDGVLDADRQPARRARSQAAMSALVRVANLRVSFVTRQTRVEAVRGVSFDVRQDATLALVGESGSGKTVSAMSILRLLPENAIVDPASRIDYGGENLLAAPAARLRALRGREISAVFQEPMSSLNPVLTVGEQVAEVLRLHRGMAPRHALERAAELLAEVGIPEPRARLRAYPHELSGGQQQRVMIAMAIANEPKLLIADEPTTALDVTVQRQVLELIARLRERHRMSVLFISHDLELVGEIADDVVVMRDGVVRESGAVERIFHAPQDPYTRALLACRPRLDARPRRLPVIDDFMRGAPVTDAPLVRPSGGAPVVEAKSLRKEFRLRTGWFASKSLVAVREVSFGVGRGRTVGLVGESGSGKTTVALLVMRLLEASGGEARLEDTDLLRLSPARMMAFRRRIQIVFQNPYA